MFFIEHFNEIIIIFFSIIILTKVPSVLLFNLQRMENVKKIGSGSLKKISFIYFQQHNYMKFNPLIHYYNYYSYIINTFTSGVSIT